MAARWMACLCFTNGCFFTKYSRHDPMLLRIDGMRRFQDLTNFLARGSNSAFVVFSSNDDKDISFDNDEKEESFGIASPSSSSFLPSMNEKKLFGVSSRNDPRNEWKVNDKEFRLVSIFEQTLPLQVFVLLIVFCWTVYIGVSGGITDGSDRGFIGCEVFDDEVGNTYFNRPQNDSTNERIIGPSIFL